MKRTLTREDYEEYGSDSVKVLKRLKKEARRKDTLLCIDQIIELSLMKSGESVEDDDGALLKRIAELEKGPSFYTKFLWKLGDVRSCVSKFLATVFRKYLWVCDHTKYVLFIIMAPIFLINMVYSIKFTTESQVFVSLIFTCGLAGLYMWLRYVVHFAYKIIPILFLGISLFFYFSKIAIIPDSDAAFCKRVGFIVRDGLVKDVVNPNSSIDPFATNGTTFRKAPNFFRDKMYVLSINDEVLTIEDVVSDSDDEWKLTVHLSKKVKKISAGEKFPGVPDPIPEQVIQERVKEWIEKGGKEDELKEIIQSILQNVSEVYDYEIKKLTFKSTKTITKDI